jgi:hypothetical protein
MSRNNNVTVVVSKDCKGERRYVEVNGKLISYRNWLARLVDDSQEAEERKIDRQQDEMVSRWSKQWKAKKNGIK